MFGYHDSNPEDTVAAINLQTFEVIASTKRQVQKYIIERDLDGLRSAINIVESSIFADGWTPAFARKWQEILYLAKNALEAYES
jgi:hypothetical protein